MPRQCEISGKKKMMGITYSFLRAHFNPNAKRSFNVNLQVLRTKDENGNPIKLRVATSVLKKNPGIKASIKNVEKKGQRRKLRKLLKTLS